MLVLPDRLELTFATLAHYNVLYIEMVTFNVEYSKK